MAGNVKAMCLRLSGLAMGALIAVAMAMAIAALPLKAHADEADVRSTAAGILKLSWHVDDADYSRGSCFLINDDTVLTAYRCTMFNETELEKYGYEEKDLQGLSERVTYSVSTDGHVEVGATLVNSSKEQDFAILKLDRPLDGYKALKIRESGTVSAGEVVFSVGFPVSADLKVADAGRSASVAFRRGSISKPEGQYQGMSKDSFAIDGYFLQTDCPVGSGGSGGPMVDSEGCVVGISVMGDSSSYFAVASDYVTPALGALGVGYVNADGTVGGGSDDGSSKSGGSAASVEYALKFTELDSAINDAEAVGASRYTEDSYKVLSTALAAAKEAKNTKLRNPKDKAEYKDAQAKVDSAAAALSDAVAGLEEKPAGLSIAWVVGIAVSIIVLVAVVAALMASRSRRGKTDQ